VSYFHLILSITLNKLFIRYSSRQAPLYKKPAFGEPPLHAGAKKEQYVSGYCVSLSKVSISIICSNKTILHLFNFKLGRNVSCLIEFQILEF
jgi:hypothetical protein